MLSNLLTMSFHASHADSTTTAGSRAEAEAEGGVQGGRLPPGAWCDVAGDRQLALMFTVMARCTLDRDAWAKWVSHGPHSFAVLKSYH